MVVGHLFPYLKNPAVFFHEQMQAHGDIVELNIAGKKIILANHPKYVRHVLQSNVDNYRKSSSYDQLKLLLGNGLLTSEGNVWTKSRKAVQPAFYKSKLEQLMIAMDACIVGTIDTWKQAVAANGSSTINATQQMLDTTLQVVNTALFGNQQLERARQINESLAECMGFTYNRMERVVNWPLWMPTLGLKRFKNHKARLNAIIDDIVAKSKQEQSGGELMALLLMAHETAPEDYSLERLREDALTLLLSGYETTAVALSWMFYLLSNHPEAQERVRAEVAQLGDGDTLNIQQLQTLKYTQAVINETLRLYPPVWSFSREAVEDDVMEGHHIAKDQMVVLSPYCLHRNPEFWEAPNEFRPERFLDTEPQRNTFFPFGAGKRLCIGSHFANTEILLFAVHTLRNFDLEFIPGQDLTFQSGITLRTQEDLRVTLKPVQQ